VYELRRYAMWAQIVKSRSRPGREEDIRRLPQEFEARELHQEPAPLRLFIFQNQNDPQEYYTLAFFESEEKARENERSPEQQQRLQHLQELFERGPGTPEYVDLISVFEWSR
jgi:heme-degrading monooxygenase HmoA